MLKDEEKKEAGNLPLCQFYEVPWVLSFSRKTGRTCRKCSRKFFFAESLFSFKKKLSPSFQKPRTHKPWATPTKVKSTTPRCPFSPAIPNLDLTFIPFFFLFFSFFFFFSDIKRHENFVVNGQLRFCQAVEHGPTVYLAGQVFFWFFHFIEDPNYFFWKICVGGFLTSCVIEESIKLFEFD